MDTDRFKREILPLKNKLYRFALSLLNDNEEAQDTVQEVFIRMWNMRTKIHTLNSPEAFAMKVTKNLCLDRLKLKRTISLEQTMSLHFTESDEETPDRRAELSDAAGLLHKLMDELPEQQKMILHLRDIEGYEYEEIEQSMEMTVNTIRVNLSRARKKLRELYLNMADHGLEKNKSYT